MTGTNLVLRIGLTPLLLVGAVVAQEPRPEADPGYARMAIETELQIPCNRIHQLLVLPGRSWVLAFGSAGCAVEWAWPDGRPNRVEFPIKDDVHAAVLSPADGRLYLAGAGGLVRRFEGGSFEIERTYPDSPLWADRTIRAVAVSPEGAILAAGGDSGQVRLYDLKTHEEILPYEQVRTRIHVLGFSPDGKRVLCGDREGRLHMFDPRDVETVRVLTLHQGPIHGIVVDANGESLFTAGADGKLLQVDIVTGNVAAEVAPPVGESVRYLAYAPEAIDGPMLVAGGPTGRIAIIDAQTLTVRKEWSGLDRDITAMAIDDRGIFLTIAYRGGKIRHLFVYKFLRGDRVAVDWMENAAPLSDAEAYTRPGARLGLQLFPARIGDEVGLQVTGWLLGFPPPSADRVELGDLITQVRTATEFQPVGETLVLPDDWEQATLQIRKQDGNIAEVTLPLLSGAAAANRGSVVNALLQEQPLYDTGFEVLESGYILSVEWDGPARQATLVADRKIRRVNDRPWSDVARSWSRFRTTSEPLLLEVDAQNGGTRKVELQPAEVLPIVRHALLAQYQALSGDMERAEKEADNALRIAEDDWRVYYHISLGFIDNQPDVVIEGLRMGIERTGHRTPLLALLARALWRTEGAGAAGEFLSDPISKRDDHELLVLYGAAQSELGNHQEAVQVLEQIREHGDPEGFVPCARSLLAIGREAEAARCYRAYYYGPDPDTRMFADDGSPRWPRRGDPSDPDFVRFIELAGKLELK